MRNRVQWQVQYWVKGEPYWWDYPTRVNDELEMIKEGWSVGDGDYVEFKYQYPGPNKRKRSRLDVDDKGCMDSDAEDEEPCYGGTYHLYPKTKEQINSKPGSSPRPMQRIFVDR